MHCDTKDISLVVRTERTRRAALVERFQIRRAKTLECTTSGVSIEGRTVLVEWLGNCWLSWQRCGMLDLLRVSTFLLGQLLPSNRLRFGYLPVPFPSILNLVWVFLSPSTTLSGIKFGAGNTMTHYTSLFFLPDDASPKRILFCIFSNWFSRNVWTRVQQRDSWCVRDRRRLFYYSSV